nr:DNA polymerase III subunit gamma and tau [Sanguibacter hominis]
MYRRYRPDSFADVIGQEHVTGPLMQALRSNRVNHAYLFSGPRGCGKTTSARILARILNCHENTEQTPRDTPCGTCPSCLDLATGGAGSLDVVEIDAASHGGVDDARELRERATFSPSRDRFKIFILDEAHMVTPQGFNALLKIVEEPPEYLKFIFATTEPDKVIGTIRSRTHHYPFRLIPPDVLAPYVETLCQQEGVQVGGGVMPLVVRAGGGSARDTLSVMDQLIAGSNGGTVDYELAVALLGYTHATLLDDVVDGLAARDGASIFRVIDRVIDSGHEPRRFVEDLLERLRDLIVISVSGESAESVLRGLPADQMERMRLQATNLGISELSRAADLANAALTEMSGATSPRLHLELLCARLLLPAADDAMVGVAARLDRLERGLGGAPVARPADVQELAASGPAAPVAAPQPSAAPAAPGRGAAAARQALAAATGRGPAATGRSADEPAAEGLVAAAPVSLAPTDDVAADAGAPAPAVRPAPVGEDLPPWDLEPPHDDERPAHSQDEVRPDPQVAQPVAPEAAVEPAPPWDVPAPRAEELTPSVDATAPEPAPAVAQEPAPAPAPVSTPAVEPATATAVEPTTASTVESTAVEPASAPAPAADAAASQDSEMLRRRWPEVLETLSNLKRATWVLVKDNAQVAELTSTTLRLTFGSAGLATTFRNGPHAQLVQQAVHETLGFEVKVEGGIDEARPSARESASAPPEEPDPGRGHPADPFAPETDSFATENDPFASATGTSAAAHEAEPHRAGPSAATVVDSTISVVAPVAEPAAAAVPAPAPEPAPAAAPAAAVAAAASAPARSPEPEGPVTDWEVVPVGTYVPDPAPTSTASHASAPAAPHAPAVTLAPVTPAPAAPSADAQSPAAMPRSATVPSPDLAPVPTGDLPGQHLTGAQAAKAALAARQAGASTRPSSPAAPVDDAIPDAEVPPDYDEEPPYAEDSVDFSETTLMGVPLVAQLLGAKVITEIVEGQA